MSPQRRAAVRWVVNLVEPLIPEPDRAERAAALEAACRASPGWAALFFAGLVSDLAGTLPGSDPWRALSGRVGQVTVGAHPPRVDGAAHPDGRAFGTWQDGADLLEPVYADVELDPALSALSAGLSPGAAALLAAAGYGWDQAHRVAEALGERVVTAGPDAVRWALHRRRAYGVLSDPWPIESAYRWSWRADQHVAGRTWDSGAVAMSLVEESVEALSHLGLAGEQD